jgi:hypothetical protein
MKLECYAGKPDTAMSCPSGLEEAGRRRVSAMRLRAALPSYTQNNRNFNLTDDLKTQLTITVYLTWFINYLQSTIPSREYVSSSSYPNYKFLGR